MTNTQMKSTVPEPLRLSNMAQILLDNHEYVLNCWLPNGKWVGKEYKPLNPTRHDTHIDSFSINIQTGVWSDFATGDKGANLVDLFGYLKSITDTDESLDRLDLFVSEHQLASQPPKPLVTRKPNPRTERIPADEMTRLPPDCDVNGNVVTASWEYRTLQNEFLFHVLRTELAPGKKEIKPCRLSGGQWHWSYPEGKFPLYNGHRFQTDAVVLFGEGEKTADVLDLLGIGIGTTSAGGSSRLMESDLSPLRKASKVIIFPDADIPGAKYATQVLWYRKISS